MNHNSACDLANPPAAQVATHFAPAGRDTPVDIDRQAALIERVSMLPQVLDAMPGMVMILNDKRQIVAANRTLLEVLNASAAEVVPKRPGEALRCIRAKHGPDGCGTSRHCTACGAVNAVVESMATDSRAVRRVPDSGTDAGGLPSA